MDYSGPVITIDTVDGSVSFPAPVAATLPASPSSDTAAAPPANQGNTKVVVGALAVVLMVLAWVGLKSHNE